MSEYYSKRLGESRKLLPLTLAVFGFLAWLILTYIPMPDPFNKALIVILVIVVVLYVLRVLGISDMPVTHI